MSSLVSVRVSSELLQPYDTELCAIAASFLISNQHFFLMIKPPDKGNPQSYSDIIIDVVSCGKLSTFPASITYLGYILLLEKFLRDAVVDKQNLDLLMDNIKASYPNGKIYTASVKGVARSIQKLLQCGGNFKKLCDLARGSLVYPTVNELRQIVGSLISFGTISESHAVRDRFEKPLETGYRDINVSIMLRNNRHIAELQLHIPEIFDANKDGITKSRDELEKMGYTFNKDEQKAVLEFVKGDPVLKTDPALCTFFDELMSATSVHIMPHYLYELIRSTKGNKNKAVKRMRVIATRLSKLIFDEAYNNYEQRIS